MPEDSSRCDMPCDYVAVVEFAYGKRRDLPRQARDGRKAYVRACSPSREGDAFCPTKPGDHCRQQQRGGHGPGRAGAGARTAGWLPIPRALGLAAGAVLDADSDYRVCWELRLEPQRALPDVGGTQEPEW